MLVSKQGKGKETLGEPFPRVSTHFPPDLTNQTAFVLCDDLHKEQQGIDNAN
jgi:hypothetical protein